MGGQNEPHYLGHRKRLKEKYANAGVKGWMEHELLEFALSFAVPRRDTKTTAKLLLKRFKTFSGVLDADIKDLRTVKGVKEHSAALLKLFKDVSIYYLNNGLTGKNIISTPGLAVDYLKSELKGASDEEFFALFLDSGNKLIASEKLQTGTVNKAAVYPRKIAERALYYKAVGVIISHNHPGGTLKPSEDDKRSTEAIEKALAAIEAELLDHVIICGTEYFSFKENNIL